jgi:hypothetical protein
MLGLSMSTELNLSEADLTEFDVLIDLPWLTVARFIYEDGRTRLDIRCNDNLTVETYNALRAQIVPMSCVAEAVEFTIDPNEFLLVDSTVEIETHYYFWE